MLCSCCCYQTDPVYFWISDAARESDARLKNLQSFISTALCRSYPRIAGGETIRDSTGFHLRGCCQSSHFEGTFKTPYHMSRCHGSCGSCLSCSIRFTL